MTGAAKVVVLVAPLVRPDALAAFVETCLADSVALIAVTGEGCAALETLVDDLIVGDGADVTRVITTTSHPGETLGEVMTFAANWPDAGPVEVVRL